MGPLFMLLGSKDKVTPRIVVVDVPPVLATSPQPLGHVFDILCRRHCPITLLRALWPRAVAAESRGCAQPIHTRQCSFTVYVHVCFPVCAPLCLCAYVCCTFIKMLITLSRLTLALFCAFQVDTLSLEDLHAFIAQALCLQGKSTSQLMNLQVWS